MEVVVFWISMTGTGGLETVAAQGGGELPGEHTPGLGGVARAVLVIDGGGLLDSVAIIE